MTGEFFNRGRMDALRKLPANPHGAGTFGGEQYNQYMSGYNSVPQTDYSGTLRDIIKLVERHKATRTKEGLVSVLSELLIKSLDEPADVVTETDKVFKDYLDLLEKYEAYDLKKGFAGLYNAVQKSKGFVPKKGELIKQIVSGKKKK